MAFLADYIYDLALAELDTNAETLHITSAEATTYTEAITTYTLGNNAVTVGAPANGDTSGRKVTIAAISGASVTGTGTATHWAIVKSTGSVLMATGALSASQAVTSGNTFDLAAFDIEIQDAA